MYHQSNIAHLARLISIKSLMNIKSDNQKSYLSILWIALEPLLLLCVFYMVFGLFLSRGNDNYLEFLLTGLVPWIWFFKSISISSHAIISNTSTLTKIALPIILFPMIAVTQTAIKQSVAFVILFLLLCLEGVYPNANWLWLLPILLVQSMICIACGVAIAIIVVFIRDILILLPPSLTALMLLSGVFFDYREVPNEFHTFLLINPLASLLRLYREVLVYDVPPDLFTLITLGASSIFAVGLVFFASSNLGSRIRTQLFNF